MGRRLTGFGFALSLAGLLALLFTASDPRPVFRVQRAETAVSPSSLPHTHTEGGAAGQGTDTFTVTRRLTKMMREKTEPLRWRLATVAAERDPELPLWKIVRDLDPDDVQGGWALLRYEEDPAVLEVLGIALRLSKLQLDPAQKATLDSIIRAGTPVERRVAALTLCVGSGHHAPPREAVREILRTEQHKDLLHAALLVAQDYDGWEPGERDELLDLFVRSSHLSVQLWIAVNFRRRSANLSDLLDAVRRVRRKDQFGTFEIGLSRYEFRATELRDRATASAFVECYAQIRFGFVRRRIAKTLEERGVLGLVADQLRDVEENPEIVAELQRQR